ncbi:SCO2523 family variant P-loop protein [Pseudofrankia inefficax]|uniref:CobQ/CobB/MinD/ParA nucleotide binding domain-containing protein n=1 Tax=Pseudofrankia inefficax (strain DSM 45817 / CECT 9037 / DDB 130130 / EuI1c) TaxID=298654 RepID=E3IWE9_PSEI1|nr:SCO2523 family variant P-loop protein [Pseudofrankia inefficax]ADP80132.1 hypothetical protein FraEuI1c_2082 [Pseudofrankia inefficax]
MLVFAVSDKGGTGRSVTGCNVAYRLALRGHDVCYLDFDFGSPTSGAIFGIEMASHGTASGAGLHSYFAGQASEPEQIDIWSRSDRRELRRHPLSSGRLVLVPGDKGGGEFPASNGLADQCRRLFLRLDDEFDVIFVDLSAGRSYAAEMSLAATASDALAAVRARWLLFHRWTRQHIIAAAGLAFEENGLLDVGKRCGHDRVELEDAMRFVRTAVLDPGSAQLAGLRPTQAAWLQDCNRDLQELAAKLGVGRTALLAEVPLDPLLQWREQLITDNDVHLAGVANTETTQAFDQVARRLVDDVFWSGL